MAAARFAKRWRMEENEILPSSRATNQRNNESANDGSNSLSPAIVNRKLMRIKRHIRYLKRCVIWTQRQVRFLRNPANSNNSALAARRLAFFESELVALKSAVADAERAYEVLDWYLACLELTETNVEDGTFWTI